MAEEFKACGGELKLGTEVQDIEETADSIILHCRNGNTSHTYHAQFLITCAGLMADRITRMLNIDTDFQIVPYRGEYYRLPAKYNQIVNHLIYPIPDPDLPSLVCI